MHMHTHTQKVKVVRLHGCLCLQKPVYCMKTEEESNNHNCSVMYQFLSTKVVIFEQLLRYCKSHNEP